MRHFERAIDSTLTALEDMRGSQSDLCQELGRNLMSLADQSHPPSWQQVFFFADDITREVLGKHLSTAQHVALRRCLCVAMDPRRVSNADLAAKLRKALANAGVKSKAGLIIEDFIKLRKAVQGPDDTPAIS